MILRFSSLAVVIAGLLLMVGCAGRQAQEGVAQPAVARTEAPRPLGAEAYHHFTNAVIYEQEGLFDDAVSSYEEALAYEPMSYDIRMALGELFMRLKRPEDALSTLLPLADKQMTTYVLIGESYRQLGQALQAKSAYRQALALDPDNAEIKEKLTR